jgi:hypothetical protein
MAKGGGEFERTSRELNPPINARSVSGGNSPQSEMMQASSGAEPSPTGEHSRSLTTPKPFSTCLHSTHMVSYEITWSHCAGFA